MCVCVCVLVCVLLLPLLPPVKVVGLSGTPLGMLSMPCSLLPSTDMREKCYERLKKDKERHVKELENKGMYSHHKKQTKKKTQRSSNRVHTVLLVAILV